MNNKIVRSGLSSKVTRREFVQFFSLGLFGAILPRKLTSLSPEVTSEMTRIEGKYLGRVTRAGFPLFESPDPDSKVIMEMPQDSLWRITGVRLNQTQDSPNRLWYALDGAGFAHSRAIQPVQKRVNKPDPNIPEDGRLGEITMPFVDAYSSLQEKRSLVYRLYYEGTFWVLKHLRRDDGSDWYELLDDRTYRVFYVPAYAVRLVPDSELAPLSPRVLPEDKKIVVDLATQRMTAYEKEEMVFRARISSGVYLREGGFATPKGTYRVTRKRPCRHMANPANDYGSGFDLPGVPWVSYFTGDGVAFHGAYWHNDFGVPHSHGCINLTRADAAWLYSWTPMGTAVVIHW